MPGPKPIPTQLKLLRGNPGKQKLTVDVMQPEQALNVPEPPPFITGYAADPKVNVFLCKSGCKYLVKPFPVQRLIDCLKQMLS